MNTRPLAITFSAALALAGCNQGVHTDTTGGTGETGEVEPYDWGLPDWYPIPAVPDDNPMTADKVELGRYLFYDERLSGNGTMSCGSCHEQARGFSDGVAKPMGSTGDTVPKNSMALAGAALFATYTWSSPKIETPGFKMPSGSTTRLSRIMRAR